MDSFVLEEHFPELAAEARTGLEDVEEPDLAAQVFALRVVDRCRCGDSFCAMMYTQPRPKGSWGPGLRNVLVPTTRGTMILDVVHGRIASVEVLDRPEVRSRLHQLLP